jgi:hypothetical protein
MPTMTDARRQRFLRWGGFAALALGIGYVITIVLYASVGAPPNAAGGEAWLAYGAGKTATWWAILGLSVVTDLLFVPAVLALYLALNRVARGAMLLATALILLFVVLDVAVTWPNYASLIALSANFAAAPTEAQRVADAAAATNSTVVLASTLFAIYAILVPSLGILVASLAMRRGAFGAGTSYVGILTGMLGIAAVVGPFIWSPLGAAAILTSTLTTVWLFLVGYRLFQLGQR